MKRLSFDAYAFERSIVFSYFMNLDIPLNIKLDICSQLNPIVYNIPYDIYKDKMLSELPTCSIGKSTFISRYNKFR